MQGPFTPFLAECIYINLKKYISAALLPEDSRSVHFLAFPQANEKLKDANIERKFQRMQKIIDLARNIRERKLISLKMPLNELIVLHHEPAYLEDIKSMGKYIREELNVLNLTLTSDEKKYGIKYGCKVDWSLLGKKHGPKTKELRHGLERVTSDDILQYLSTGKLQVGEILLEGDEVIVRIL